MTAIANTASSNTPHHEADKEQTYSKSMASFARDSGTGVYAARDVIGQSGTAILEFPLAVKRQGGAAAVLRAHVNHADLTPQTAGATLRLWLFDAEPSAHVDNASLNLIGADQVKIVGLFSFVTPIKSGGDQTHWISGLDPEQVFVLPEGATSLYGFLEISSVGSGWTPEGSAQVTVTLDLRRD